MFDIALFGAGRIGRIHARNVVAHPALRLKYLVDPAQGAAELAEQTGAALVAPSQAFNDSSIAGINPGADASGSRGRVLREAD